MDEEVKRITIFKVTLLDGSMVMTLREDNKIEVGIIPKGGKA